MTDCTNEHGGNQPLGQMFENVWAERFYCKCRKMCHGFLTSCEEFSPAEMKPEVGQDYWLWFNPSISTTIQKRPMWVYLPPNKKWIKTKEKSTYTFLSPVHTFKVILHNLTYKSIWHCISFANCFQLSFEELHVWVPFVDWLGFNSFQVHGSILKQLSSDPYLNDNSVWLSWSIVS